MILKINKLYFIRIKTFAFQKILSRNKKLHTEKMFENHIPHKELISRIYKELSKLNDKNKQSN